MLNTFINIHKGETCYIFGDGPSIKWFDYRMFTDQIGIACGNQFLHNDFNLLKIKYYTIPEPWLFCPPIIQPHRNLKDHTKITREYKLIFGEHCKIKIFINLSNYLFMRGDNIYYIHRYLKMFNKKLRGLSGVDPFGGSFHTVLSLAYLMGFSNVYLIGFDAWVLSPHRTRRWYEKGEGDIYTPNPNNIGWFINLMAEQMSITAITYNGHTSSIVETVDYKDYTGEEPKYKENIQICDKRYLNLMDTHPMYKIF